MAELVQQLSETDRMLCPRSMTIVGDSAHMLSVRYQDLIYNALKPYRDENTDELPEDSAAAVAVEQAMYGDRVTDRMWLMRDETSFVTPGRFTTVETYWWECRLCGFVLPCTTVEHKP